ncbi:MAG: 16S rRNA (cytosine(1402)-N(4))-methyltransferase RsmH [Kiritimatiellia bacterium]
MSERAMHRPVLVKEVVEFLVVTEGGTYVDATVGSGGHARAILERAGPKARLLGIDRDEEAIRRCRESLWNFREQIVLVHGNFVQLEKLVAEEGIQDVDGILFDLGVSSEQLEDPERGFSFLKDGPLDMRMDRSQATSAQHLLRNASEAELFRILRDFGQERNARRIARAVVRERAKRPLLRTSDLVQVVGRVVGGSQPPQRIHPATRTFQAIRIAVNDELNCLEQGLAAALAVVRTGARIAVITFHSGEDRVVKHFFARHVGRMESLPGGGCAWRGETPRVRLLSRRPIVPTPQEVLSNPRARSAKLRVVEIA